METASRQAAERSHTAELAQLHLKPTSRWPPDLQRLVEQRESAAAEVYWCRVVCAERDCLAQEGMGSAWLRLVPACIM